MYYYYFIDKTICLLTKLFFLIGAFGLKNQIWPDLFFIIKYVHKLFSANLGADARNSEVYNG